MIAGKDGPPWWDEAPAPDHSGFPNACDVGKVGVKTRVEVEPLDVRTFKVSIPEAFDFLFEKARYKVCYGGRILARAAGHHG